MYVAIKDGHCYGPFDNKFQAQTFADTVNGNIMAVERAIDTRTIYSVYEAVDFFRGNKEQFYLIKSTDTGLILMKKDSRLRWDHMVWPDNTQVQKILDYYGFTCSNRA